MAGGTEGKGERGAFKVAYGTEELETKTKRTFLAIRCIKTAHFRVVQGSPNQNLISPKTFVSA